MFGGLPQIFTGFKTNSFSVSLNERYPTYLLDPSQLWTSLGLLIAGASPAGYLIRETLDSCSNYTCAVKKLSETLIASPAYIIVGGTGFNEGAVISRDRWRSINISNLTDETWYLVQTNDD